MPSDMTPLSETWTTQDLPILRAALQRADAGESYIALPAIQAEVGLESNQMRAGLAALEPAFPPYLTVQHAPCIAASQLQDCLRLRRSAAGSSDQKTPLCPAWIFKQVPFLEYE
jgi:hypothetical protein